MYRHRNTPHFETLEIRTALDASGVFGPHFEPSEFVKENPNGSLRFASLRVGEVTNFDDPFGPSIVLEDSDVVKVAERDVSMGQVKAYLHGFADSLGTDLIIETADLRFSSWGSGSGSTSQQFNHYMQTQLESFEICEGLEFSSAVRFDLPGEGGEFFTGGFLEIGEDGRGGLLRGGDIVEVVENYDISVDPVKTELTVNTMFGDEMAFTVNADKTLTDEFGRIWTATADYSILDPDAVDQVVGEEVGIEAGEGVVGDIDGNGVVEFADFLILSNNFGQETDQGDLNGDGTVDFADFLLLADNFGN